MTQVTTDQALQLAIQHHNAGRMAEAEGIYRQILAHDPGNVQALNLLGRLARQMGQLELAAEIIREAIRLNPDFAEAHNNLGNTLKGLKQVEAAIVAYREAIRLQPDHAEALANLGNALNEIGQFDEAINCCRHGAIAVRPGLAGAHNNLGNALQLTGKLPEAIASYQRAISFSPDAAQFHNNLGSALADNGQNQEAIASYHRAIALRPDYAEAYGNLGNALKALGRLEEAIEAYRRAIQLLPGFADAHSLLGSALSGIGHPDEAIASIRHALTLNPALAMAHCHLGNALRKMDRFDEAIGAYRRAIELNPSFTDAQNNLGNALVETGRIAEGIACYQEAIRLKPGLAAAYNNLGNALRRLGHLDEPISLHRQAVQLKPDLAPAHNNLAEALLAAGRVDEAMESHREAIRLSPTYATAHANLGNALKDLGRLDEAIACYGQAIRLQPDFADAHSNLVYTLLFHPDYDARQIRDANRLWNEKHAAPVKKFAGPYQNDRNADRRLRIGYVSPDFRDHVVGRNLLPLLREHDHQQMEIFCYSNGVIEDWATEKFRSYADCWQSIFGKSDAKVADLIQQDKIDILVDLSLHMSGNRLTAFARKPAPVQVTFAGYPGSTGLETIDYRLSDPFLDPEGSDESIYSEKTVRLPDSFWCYDPLGTESTVNPLPAQTNGFITFGCLNNFCKVNASVLRLWTQVLKAVPASRLMLHCFEGKHREILLESLQSEGIDRERVEFFSRLPRRQYLELYHRIDIGLDTFPYNGHTTSLDSIWMGVPVITLAGETVVGRAGVSQLSNLGMPELIAQTPEDYVRIATELAGDPSRLAELRRILRSRMEASPLMDAPKFARGIEAAYRRIWRAWCAAGEAKQISG